MTSKASAKRRKPVVTVAAVPWDQGATGPANQIGLVTQERGEVDLATGRRINPNRVFGKVRMPIFMRYQRQGRLTQAHVATAQRIYAAWAGYPSKDPIAAIADRVDGGGGSDANVSAIDKRREFYILKAMIPARSWAIVEHVVLSDLPIGCLCGADAPEVFAVHLARLVEGLEAVK